MPIVRVPSPGSYSWESVRQVVLSHDALVDAHVHAYRYATQLYLEHVHHVLTIGVIFSFSVPHRARILATLLAGASAATASATTNKTKKQAAAATATAAASAPSPVPSTATASSTSPSTSSPDAAATATSTKPSSSSPSSSSPSSSFSPASSGGVGVNRARELLELCMSTPGVVSLSEMMKMAQLLDSARLVRQLLAKLKTIEKLKEQHDQRILAQHQQQQQQQANATSTDQANANANATLATAAAAAATPDAAAANATQKKKKKKRTMNVSLLLGKVRNQLSNACAEVMTPVVNVSGGEAGEANDEELNAAPVHVGLSGAKQKFFTRWCRTLSGSKLDFWLLNFPCDYWRALADLVHVNGATHFTPDAPYFVPTLYTTSATPSTLPPDSTVALARTATPQNLAALLTAHPQLAACYSYFRNKFKEMSDVKAADARKATRLAITALGFSDAAARYAMARSGSSRVHECVDYLIEHAAEVSAAIDAQQQQPSSGGDADDDVMFTREAKQILARTAPLETLIWWYEELACEEVERAITERLAAGESLLSTTTTTTSSGGAANGSSSSSSTVLVAKDRCNYGKLMERVCMARERNLSFAPLLLAVAEQKLTDLKHALSSPTAAAAAAAVSVTGQSTNAGGCGRMGATGGATVAVLGDSSGSMECAIKGASTLASLLSVALSAELMFFAETSYPPWGGCAPRSAAQVLDVIAHTRAEHATSMASALYPYVERAQRVDLFVLVSDEMDNTPFRDTRFAPLWLRYRREVHPTAQLVLVSFLDVGEAGLIKQQLAELSGGGDGGDDDNNNNNNNNHGVTQYRLHRTHPDTSKFDQLLSVLSYERMALSYHANQLKQTLENVAHLPTPLAHITMQY